MKIIIPVSAIDDKENSEVKGFHNTEYVCVYNCISETYEWLSKTTITEKEGNMSIELKRRGVSTIISKEMPLMALALFTESGFKVLKSKSENVKGNIELYYQNKLEPFTFQSPDIYSSCGNTCGTCNSSCK